MPKSSSDASSGASSGGLPVGLLVRLLGVLIVTIAAALVVEQRRPRRAAISGHSPRLSTIDLPPEAELIVATAAVVPAEPAPLPAVADPVFEGFPDPWSVVADLVTDDAEDDAEGVGERLRARAAAAREGWNEWLYTTPMSQIVWAAAGIASILIIVTVVIVVALQK